MNIKKFLGKTMCMTLATAAVLSVGGVYAQKITTQQINDLKTYKIMVGDAESGDLRLNDSITRAEAAKMLCTAAKLDLSLPEDSFSDVTDSHWAYKYVSAAKRCGLVSGDENGNFNPDANVSNEEFVKMAVCAIGYEPFAEMTGGYPMGYINAATRYGLTKDLQLTPEEDSKREDAAIIIANALDIPLMVKKGGSEDEEWVIMDGTGDFEKQTLRMRIESNK